jgi:hypothetical protein
MFRREATLLHSNSDLSIFNIYRQINLKLLKMSLKLYNPNTPPFGLLSNIAITPITIPRDDKNFTKYNTVTEYVYSNLFSLSYLVNY